MIQILVYIYQNTEGAGGGGGGLKWQIGTIFYILSKKEWKTVYILLPSYPLTHINMAKNMKLLFIDMSMLIFLNS